MESNVSYKHFTPDINDRQSCSELINVVTELSPCDVWVRAIVDRVSDGTYRSIISVKGMSRNFDCIKNWKKH